MTPTDIVNHPPHYADGWSNGAEVIDITENLNFNRGNAVKYIARAGSKDPAKEIEDLQKAQWYISRELARLAGHHATEDPEVVEARSWPSLDDVPKDVAVYSSGGCRWRHEGTSWWWSSSHAAKHGYRYDKTGPFTEETE